MPYSLERDTENASSTIYFTHQECYADNFRFKREFVGMLRKRRHSASAEHLIVGCRQEEVKVSTTIGTNVRGRKTQSPFQDFLTAFSELFGVLS
jgi:hypothetical protein